jgi:Alginate lyase
MCRQVLVMLPNLFSALGALRPPKLSSGKTRLPQVSQTELADMLTLPKSVSTADLSQSPNQVKISDAMTMLKAVLVAMFSNLLAAFAQPASFMPPQSLIRQEDNAVIQQQTDVVKTDASSLIAANPATTSPVRDSQASRAKGVDLSKLNLQVSQGNKVVTIRNSDLQDGYSSEFYRHNSNSGSVTLTMNAAQATTAHSKHPRAEFKESKSWIAGAGLDELDATLHLDKRSKSGRVVVGQIIGSGVGPVAELKVIGDQVFSLIQTEDNKYISEPVGKISPNGDIVYKMAMKPGGIVELTVNGSSKSYKVAPRVQNAPVSFKAGNYLMDNTGGPTNISQITFSSLQIKHS